MRALSIVAAATIFALAWTPPAHGFLEAVATGLEVIVHTIESIQQTWEIVEATDVLKQKNEANPNIKNMVSRKHHELMSRLTEIYRAIESIEHDTINTASWTIDSINKHVVDSLSLELRLNELADLINRISVEELNMRDYAENYDKLDPVTIRRYAEWTISPHSNAIMGMLDRVHSIVIGSSDLDYIGKKSLLAQLAAYLQVSNT